VRSRRGFAASCYASTPYRSCRILT
jgi:hypothetical protein